MGKGDGIPQALKQQLGRIEWKLGVLLLVEVRIMATIADVDAAVSAESDVVNSAVTLLDQLKQMLQDALNSGDPAAVQAVLDKIAASKQNLADAVARNTPAAP